MEKLLPVSILIPIRNEAHYIGRALESVLAQDYAAERTEILIIDGISTDGTREIIAGFQQRNPDRAIYWLDNPQRIVPTGLNIALRQARGEVIIRVDGHCEISRDYVSRCVQALENEGVDCVGGPIETIGETRLSQAIALGMSSKFGVGGSAFRTVKDRAMLVDSVAFPAYTRQVIRRVGLFDEELVRNQDDEYNYRLRKLGGKILLTPAVKSRYYSRGSYKSLWRQYFQYGYWKVRVLQKHPGQMQPRQFIPFLFVLSLIGSGVLAFFSLFGKILLALILAAYLAANLIATVGVASQKGWRYGWTLPLVFAILHLSYGLGFLTGLIRFVHRWGDKTGLVPEFQGSDA